MIHEDEEIYITRCGVVRPNQMEDAKKKKGFKKKGQASSPGAKIIRAKAVVPTKAQRGFTTKRPPKVHLSYPL